MFLVAMQGIIPNNVFIRFQRSSLFRHFHTATLANCINVRVLCQLKKNPEISNAPQGWRSIYNPVAGHFHRYHIALSTTDDPIKIAIAFRVFYESYFVEEQT